MPLGSDAEDLVGRLTCRRVVVEEGGVRDHQTAKLVDVVADRQKPLNTLRDADQRLEMISHVLDLVGRGLLGCRVSHAAVDVVGDRGTVERQLAGMLRRDLRRKPKLRLEVNDDPGILPVEIGEAQKRQGQIGVRPFDPKLGVRRNAIRSELSPDQGSVSGGIALSVLANLKIFGLRDQLNFRSRCMGMDELPVMVPVGG